MTATTPTIFHQAVPPLDAGGPLVRLIEGLAACRGRALGADDRDDAGPAHGAGDLLQRAVELVLRHVGHVPGL